MLDQVSVGEEQELSNQLPMFWETESIGVTMEKEQSIENMEALRKFEETIKYDTGRYEVCLPWKEDQMMIDDYDPAENRFSQLVRTLQHNPTMYDRYDVIQEYLAEGILKMVHSKSSDNPIYYLPHHAIVREQRTTTKLRAVFDASSHAKDSLSLNEGLLTGPNLNPDLLSILVKFRQH